MCSEDKDISTIKVKLSKTLIESFKEIYFEIIKEFLKMKKKAIELEVDTNNSCQYEIILVK